MVLKTSPRGVRFFAHKAVADCAAAPETGAHLHLKQMVVTAARANGWAAGTEITGSTPAGAPWKADVLAQKGKRKVAIEIQWSGQTNEETLRRQRRYWESGIRGLWLLRQPGFPVTRELPAACIGGSLEDGFQALVPDDNDVRARDRRDPSRWSQAFAMDAFLNAVFDGRFRFGVQPDGEAAVSICGAEDFCWSCGAETMVASRIEISFGPHMTYFLLADFGKQSGLVPVLLRNLPASLGIGTIKERFSKPMGERYLSNGCAHCGALFGHHFAFELNSMARVLHTFPVRITLEWKRAIECQWREKWGVYERRPEREGHDVPRPRTK